MSRFVLFLLLVSPFLAISQGKIYFEQKPTWLEPVGYDLEPHDTLHSGGYFYLLLERQVNVERQETYRRTSIKVLTESGLETASSISINFDPSYQKVAFHNVVVRRGDKTIDKLRTNKFEFLRREENMDRLVYDKSIDGILNLDDIQVGDIIEYDYTTRGNNPVFEGKFFQTQYLNYSIPVGKIYASITCNKNKRLFFKTFNSAVAPTETEKGTQRLYRWEVGNVPALLSEDRVPSWYDGYDNIEISEYSDWSEISKWALPLYTAPLVSPEIDAKIDQLKTENNSLEDQIVAAIQFVQDEIRYLSFSDGIQGYKPHKPAEVFKQRFGDCKDKSLLLSYMLRKLGLKSYPALVSTTLGKVIDKSLPSPGMFDHCIAQFELRDSIYWVDPTIKLQRGQLSTRYTPNYHNALVISPETERLVAMGNQPKLSSIRVAEDYSFKIVGGTGTLKVTTTYTGADADDIRQYWKSNSAEEIKSSYTNFYANEYPDIQADEYVQFTDNEEDNILTSVENYTIETLWTYDSASQRRVAEFYSRIVANYLNVPSTKRRVMPYSLTHPLNVSETITISLPEPWNVTEANKTIESPAFRFTSEIDYVENAVKIYRGYSTLNDHIEADGAKDFVDKIQAAQDNLLFQLTYSASTEGTASSNFNMPFLLFGLVLTPFMLLGLRRLFFYDPRSRDYSIAYESIGGWLILPAIGIFLSPVWSLVNLFSNGYFNYLNWQILTNPSHASYNPSLGVLVLIEYIYHIGILCFSILLIVLLYNRRTSFPFLVCCLYGVNVLVLVVEAVWLRQLDLPTGFEGEDALSSYRAIMSAMIWIPFFIYSDRVKGTFRERLP